MDYYEIVKHMSLREQARLVTGADFWHTWAPLKYGMPSVMMSDGPNGLRKQVKGKTITSVCFPSVTALAASWDRSVLAQVGGALADDCKANRVSVLLGPGINIKRSPLCGRNFEYYSEDPVLAGELAASYINAVQEKGVGTSLKHFAANSTEKRRMVSNSLVDDRALREIYLRGFEIAVKKAQPWTVMMAYNKLNGTYCTENMWLMEHVLRGEWGFKGLTVSDWMAVDDRVKSIENGLDLEMPGTGYANVRKIAKAYRQGKFDLSNLNVAASKIAELVTKSEPLLRVPAPARNLDGNHEVARITAEQCPVLLKNNGALPIMPGQTIAIIGQRADKIMYQGAGSAGINSYKVVSVIDAFKAANTPYVYAQGYDINMPAVINSRFINEAVAAAKVVTTPLVFVSCDEIDATEGADRVSMGIPKSQVALIEAVCNANPNTAVILTSGSCVEMPWVNLPSAILQTYLLGEAQGTAVHDIIMGRVSPSGKLPETYPVRFEDTPCPENYQTQDDNNLIYKESIYVGYRYYEKANVPVLFPFGHGLSYTSFSYSDLALSTKRMTPNDTLTLSFNITNNGGYAAAETAQVYVGLKDSLVYRAKKELKEFAKVFVNPGQTQTVTVELDRSAFEYYSPTLKAWVVEPGDYDIYIGSSSADIRLTAIVEMDSRENSGEINYAEATPRYWNADIKNVDEEDFVDIFGSYPSEFVPKRTDDRVTRDNCLDELKDQKNAKKIIGLMETVIGTVCPDPAQYAIIYNSIATIPLKRFTGISLGALSDATIDGFVHYFNTGSVADMLKVISFGIPDTALNLIDPLARKIADKMSTK